MQESFVVGMWRVLFRKKRPKASAKHLIFPLMLLLLLLHSDTNCQEGKSAAAKELTTDPHQIVSEGLGSILDSFLTEMSQKGYSGTVLVAKGDQIVLKKGYGLANRELGIPNRVETVFNICSLSKTFTAAAILKLQEEGKLSTQDPISKYLGKFPEKKEQATIHQLLIHTAGLAKAGTPLDYDDRESFVRSMKNAPIDSIPGEKSRYSNAGYTLLAAIVEEVSGMPFEQYIYREILEPAGMSHTAFIWDARFDNAPLAVGYEGKSMDQLVPAPRNSDTWGDRGPGSLGSTVGDLYKWMLALQDNSILSSTSREQMFTAYNLDDGYGWNIKETEFGLRRDKGCGLPEFESQLAWYPEQDVVIVFTINNHIGFRVPVWEGIENRILCRIFSETFHGSAALSLAINQELE